MRRKHAIAGIALLGLVLGSGPAFAVGSPAPTGTSAVRLATLAPRVPSGSARLGSVPSSQPITITIALRPSHSDRLSALLRDLYDPTSSRYEQWLAPGEFNREFGPSTTEIDAVTSWLHRRGLNDISVNGLAIQAAGRARDIADALGVSFSRYRLRGQATGYVASAAPLVPQSIAGDITSIVGLSDTLRLHNSLRVAPGVATRGVRSPATVAASSGCATARNFAGNKFWTPDQIGNLYGVNNLHAAGLTGKGTTVALVEFAPSIATDTNSYLSCFGLHNNVTVERINGGSPSDPNGTVEAEIDIQEVATQAPGASILSYEAPNNGAGEYALYNRIVSEDRAQVVSTSWGNCESDVAASGHVIDAMATVFKQAAAQGQTVFAASGDTGSEGCFDGSSSTASQSLDVDHPASDPFVTGVGGTALVKPGHDPVWNDCEGERGSFCAQSGGSAAGSGLSKHFKRPSWQPVAPHSTCPTCRQVPDISANSGVYEIFYDSGWIAVGGTSIAAPTLAGIAADIDQGSKAGRLGDFAPKLAALAAEHVYGSALTDVTTGINWNNLAYENPGSTDLTRTHGGAYKTGPGLDLATGFGTPLAGGLACPQIDSMSRGHGKAGVRVTLHGIGLERATIKFGHNPATVVSATVRTAVVTVPKGSGTVTVTARDPMGTGNRPARFSYRGS